MPSGRDLSQREISEILRRNAGGEWPAQIAKRMGLCHKTVVKVISGARNSDKSSPR
jgi:DNA-binding NarL/FixJ family response regulator